MGLSAPSTPLATNTEAKAVTSQSLATTPGNLAAVFAEPPALGSTTPAVVTTSTLQVGASDVKLERDAANTLAQRNGANAQTYRLYNTYTDGSNYERVALQWAGNELTLASEAAGTGTGRDIVLSLPSSGARVFARGSSSVIQSNLVNHNTQTGIGAGSGFLFAAGGTTAFIGGMSSARLDANASPTNSRVSFRVTSNGALTGADTTAVFFVEGSASGAVSTFNTPVKWGTDNTYDLGASGATRPRSLYLGTGLGWKSGSAAPTTTDIPASQWMLWKNTTDGTVKLYANDGGTLKSVTLA